MQAAGLNFRDVTIALGLVERTAFDAGLGSEGAGVVLEVADDVTGLAPGDRVLGIFPGAFAPVAVADHRLVTAIPDGWSFAEAASMPSAFLTAYHALFQVTTLAAGQRILIHAGAGGVGMAAVQLAKHVGPRSTPPPAPASGPRCGPWESTTNTWPRHATWSSPRSSRPPRTVAGSMSC